MRISILILTLAAMAAGAPVRASDVAQSANPMVLLSQQSFNNLAMGGQNMGTPGFYCNASPSYCMHTLNKSSRIVGKMERKEQLKGARALDRFSNYGPTMTVPAYQSNEYMTRIDRRRAQ